MEKLEPMFLAGGNGKRCNFCEKGIIVYQKIRHWTTGYIPQENEKQKLKQISVDPCLQQLIHNSQNVEANQTSINWCCCCSVTKWCLTLWNTLDCSTPGFLVLHYLPQLTHTHVHQVGDAIQPSHPLSPSSPPAFNLSQHQGLFLWVGSSHQEAKILELQLQHQSFQRLFRVDLF